MADLKYKDIGSLLTKAVEECSEVIRIACKIDRFGWFNHHPDRPEKNNMELLKREMDDVVDAFNALEKAMQVLSAEHYMATNQVPHKPKAICSACGGRGYTMKYFDAGDHFGAGTAPGSGWEREPCKFCKAT
jgi:hypothetical protein